MNPTALPAAAGNFSRRVAVLAIQAKLPAQLRLHLDQWQTMPRVQESWEYTEEPLCVRKHPIQGFISRSVSDRCNRNNPTRAWHYQGFDSSIITERVL